VFAASSVKNIRRGDSHRPRSVASELVPVCIALSRQGLLSSSRPTSAGIVSSCGIPLMPAVLHVVGFGRGFGSNTGRQRPRPSQTERKSDAVTTAATIRSESETMLSPD